MKNFILLFVALSFSLNSFSEIPYRIIENTLSIGDGTTSDVKLEADLGSGVNNPHISLDSTTGKWTFLNVGATSAKNFGSGSGSGGSGGVNVLVNSGGEDGIEGYTNVGGTLSSQLYINPIEGNEKYLRFVATASGQYFQQIFAQWPENISGGCMADFKYIQGDSAFTYEIIEDPAGTPLVISSGTVADLTEWVKSPTITFTCPSSGVAVAIRIESTGSGTIEIDDSYLGSNKNISPVGKTSHFIGSAKWPFNTSHIWTSSVSSGWGSFPSDTDSLTPSVEGLVSVSDKNVPIITISGAKKGRYVVTASGAKFAYQNSSNNGGLRFFDGTNSWGGARTIVSNDSIATITGGFTVLSDGDITLELQGYASSTGNIEINNQEIGDFVISVFYFPLGSETQEAFTPEQADFFIDVSIGGLSTSQGASSTPTAVVGTTLDMVLNKGSAKIPCVGLEASGLTCPSSDEQVGVVFNAPVSGDYKVCSSFILNTSNFAALRIERTNVGTDTIIENGRGIGSNDAILSSTRICSIFAVLSVGDVELKLFYVGTGTTSLTVDRSSSSYNRDANFTVELVSHNVSRPIIQNMVDTSVGSGVRTDSCDIANNGTATIVNTSELCEWVDSVLQTAAGLVEVNYSVYSAPPICQITTSLADNRICGNSSPATSTKAIALCEDAPTGTNINDNFVITCTGKR